MNHAPHKYCKSQHIMHYCSRLHTYRHTPYVPRSGKRYSHYWITHCYCGRSSRRLCDKAASLTKDTGLQTNKLKDDKTKNFKTRQAMYVCHILARSRNHCCHGNATLNCNRSSSSSTTNSSSSSSIISNSSSSSK